MSFVYCNRAAAPTKQLKQRDRKTDWPDGGNKEQYISFTRGLVYCSTGHEDLHMSTLNLLRWNICGEAGGRRRRRRIERRRSGVNRERQSGGGWGEGRGKEQIKA